MNDIRARAQQINMPLSHLADKAGVSRWALLRGGVQGRGSNTRTVDAAAKALAKSEREMLLHLLKLHGPPESWPAPVKEAGGEYEQ